MGRDYVLKRRADRMDETRKRITDAVVHLHGTVGPAKTTISAIAERAGVERLTVYRHFPDETALFEACTSQWRAANPAPDPLAWTTIADGEARVRAALAALYPYYRRNRAMLSNSERDRAAVPALAAQMAGLDAYRRAVRDILAAPWRAPGVPRRLVKAAIGHALDFRAWQSLADQGVGDRDAASLMTGLVRAASLGVPAPPAGRLPRARANRDR